MAVIRILSGGCSVVVVPKLLGVQVVIGRWKDRFC